jgi:acetoin utilization deacetylase AcuC-like enzyme
MAARWLTVVGDALQLLGVVAIVWDVLDVRRVLGLPNLRRLATEWAARLARQLRARLFPPKPRVIQTSATIHESLSFREELTTRVHGPSVRDDIEHLWNALETWMARTNKIISEETETRAAGFAGVQRDMSELREEVQKLVTRVAGTHHVRRLVFAGFVLVGLILSLIGAAI